MSLLVVAFDKGNAGVVDDAGNAGNAVHTFRDDTRGLSLADRVEVAPQMHHAVRNDNGKFDEVVERHLAQAAEDTASDGGIAGRTVIRFRRRYQMQQIDAADDTDEPPVVRHR